MAVRARSTVPYCCLRVRKALPAVVALFDRHCQREPVLGEKATLSSKRCVQLFIMLISQTTAVKHWWAISVQVVPINGCTVLFYPQITT